MNVDWTDWNTLNSVTLEGTRNLGLPGDLALAFNWQASWLYEAGVTRYFDNDYFLSAGYFFSSVECLDLTQGLTDPKRSVKARPLPSRGHARIGNLASGR